MQKKDSRRLRFVVALAVLGVVSIGFMVNTGIGTISALGWNDISLLCPLGALGTMLASKLLVPQALISLVVAVVFIITLGRAFCGWICPVPLIQRLRDVFKKPSGTKSALSKAAHYDASAEGEALKGCSEDCGSCARKREKLDSRHFILGGSLLSAAIFGFPVFCLVCPIGLTFATVLLVIRLFSGGDVTLSLILVPAILVLELLVFRKWCHRICPLSAFMSLIAKANRTFRPHVNESKCLAATQGRECGLCARMCEEGIDPRNPQLSEHDMSECTRCRVCVDVCPGNAITIPFVRGKKKEKLETDSS